MTVITPPPELVLQSVSLLFPSHAILTTMVEVAHGLFVCWLVELGFFFALDFYMFVRVRELGCMVQTLFLSNSFSCILLSLIV